jgi:oligoendopeptidase F
MLRMRLIYARVAYNDESRHGHKGMNMRTVRRRTSFTIVLFLLSGGAAFPAPGATEHPAAAQSTGSAAADKGSWDLTDLYATPEDWDASFERTSKKADGLTQYRGTLGGGASSMLAALVAVSDTRREADRLLAYAYLKSDEDIRVGANIERKQKAMALRVVIEQKTAWIAPEILAIGPTKAQAFRAADPALDRRFGFFLEDTLRAAPHTLSSEVEDVIAATGNLRHQPGTIHALLANAEFPSPTITLADGTTARLDEPGYEKYRGVMNRADRKKVFDAYWGEWKKLEGTTGAVLAASILGDHFAAEQHRFASDLEASQFKDNMPDVVYRTLVAETNAGLPTLHRYLRLRRQELGITDELRYYDNYPPLYQPAHAPTFGLEESERITIAALAPLGEEYLGLLRTGFSAHWMNAYPHEGKASGGYMNPLAYDVHPYLLLNHNDDYDSLSTVAHEWGHAVHTLLADRAQPFGKSGYSIFTAETASIGNEMLLNDYLIAHARNRDEKLFYVGQGLESIRTTFFRQVLFAEFELELHREVEQGHGLSGQRMSEMYCALLKKYYGEADGVMRIDPGYCVEWTYISHYYNSFYVYQYATSMAGAATLTDAILEEGAPARARFLALLRAGGSDYPFELYKRAGIDMSTPGPYRSLVARMNRLLDEFEAAKREKGS